MTRTFHGSLLVNAAKRIEQPYRDREGAAQCDEWSCFLTVAVRLTLKHLVELSDQTSSRFVSGNR